MRASRRTFDDLNQAIIEEEHSANKKSRTDYTCELNNKSTDDDRRHCSFCLKISRTLFMCSRCRLRAYCSLQCQLDDWRMQCPNDRQVRGIGQDHGTWCGLQCGEEDVDWQVRSIPGRGLGVVAKRFIGQNWRIIVENVTLESDSTTPKHTRPFRIAQVNHDCRPNAAIYSSQYVSNREVFACVLYAVRDIEPGEEICINYVDPMQLFGRVTLNKALVELLQLKLSLARKWGIVCNSDCVCNSSSMYANVIEALIMNVHKESWKDSLLSPLKAAQDFVDILDCISPAPIPKALVRCNIAFSIRNHVRALPELEFASQESDLKWQKAQQYLLEAYSVLSNIIPLSVLTKKLEVDLKKSVKQR